jgi:3-oxoadipate enol-lactonase
LIHGLGWDAGRLWAGVLSALAEAGFRAYAPNLRGVGGTEATDAAYTTDLYARDLEAFLDAFGIDRLPVVGFSMGASIAGALGGAVVQGVGPDTRLRRPARDRGRAARGRGDAGAGRNARGPPPSPQNRPRRSFARLGGGEPGAVEDFKRWRAGDEPGRALPGVPVGLRRRHAGRGAGRGTADAGDRRRYDAFCELDDMRAMAEAIPGARFDVIEACGHMATIEQLEAFNRVLVGFLQDEGPRMRIGLVTGSAPFAGLPDNPAADLLGPASTGR